MHFISRFVATVSALTLLTLPASAETRVALIIGNSNYEHAKPLDNPANDANDVSNKLVELGFDVVRGTDLTAQAFQSKLREFSDKLRNADVALLFYAGHGVAVSGINYLIPVDARLESASELELEAVQLAKIQHIMEQRTRINIIIFDACRNNPFAQNIARSLGTRSAIVQTGWAPVDLSAETYITFATKPGDVAGDGTGRRNSPFTTAILKHIDTPDTDIEDVMKRVRRDVITATTADGRKQVPWTNTSMVSRFVFAQHLESSSVTNTQISIRSNKQSYRQGDKIKLYITPPKDCRLTLLNFDGAGRSCLQFPHPKIPEAVLKANQRFVFPPKGSLTLGDAGTETFIAMCDASERVISAATRNRRMVNCSKGPSDRKFNDELVEIATLNLDDDKGRSPTSERQKHTVFRNSISIKVAPK